MLAGTIVVELQPVAVRGLKIYSLACRSVLAPVKASWPWSSTRLSALASCPPIGVEDGYMQQAGVALRRRRRPAGTVPGVQADVVVLAPAEKKAASTRP